MTAGPQRRTVRRKHLDASVVPVERALLGRADALAKTAASDDEEGATMPRDIAAAIEGEFRALAEELHWTP